MLELDIDARVGQLELRARLATRGPLVLVGPNGSGKTSLLRILLGVIQPHRGRIALGDTILFDSAAGKNLPTEARGLAYVPQDLGLFPHMSVLENVEFALANLTPRPRQITQLAQRFLEELEIGELAPRRPGTLSGGEKQRVAMARALAARPRALLLDEPLAAMDASARRQIRSFLAAHLARLELPSLVVTHDPAAAAVLGQQIAVMEKGQIVQTGTFGELRAQPLSPFVAELLRYSV
jgi:ABC-type sulfate/molybdate transport systems ATPase subunit